MAKKLEEIKEEECPYELPEGWKWERLGNVAVLERGITFPSSAKEICESQNNIICLRTANVQENLKLDDLIYVDRCYFKGNDNKLIKKNDIIMSTANSRELVGKVSFIYEVIKEMTFGGFIMAIRTSVENNKYLFYLLRNYFYLGKFRGDATQTTNLANINSKQLNSLLIPLAQKETQQKIVDIIESLFAKLDIAQEKVEQVLAESENRRSAILHNAFSGKLTEKWRKENNVPFDSWKNVKISDIFSLKAGKTMSAKNISDTCDDINKYECYGGNGIRGYVESFNKEGEHPIIGRQGALCGNIHLATGKFYATEHAVVVDYLYDTDTTWAVENLRFLNLNQYSASVAQPGLAVKKIMEVPITFPTYEEQREIGNLLCKLLYVEDKVKSTCQSTLEAIATMRKSILAKAFRGELIS